MGVSLCIHICVCMCIGGKTKQSVLRRRLNSLETIEQSNPTLSLLLRRASFGFRRSADFQDNRPMGIPPHYAFARHLVLNSKTICLNVGRSYVYGGGAKPLSGRSEGIVKGSRILYRRKHTTEN